MKIDPEGKYDQFVFNFLNKIKFLLKEADSDQITYIATHKPHSGGFWDVQLIIDKFAKENVLKVVNVYEAKGGTSPEFESVNFVLKFNKARFEKIYHNYKKSFELLGKDRILISKSGKVIFYCNGIKHEAVFKAKTNAYEALLLLSSKRPEVLGFETINAVLKRKKLDTDSSEEDRVRETIKYIKKKLKYKGDRLFDSDFGFGLIPEVEIKDS